jgi:hypothetical protein
MMFLIITAAMWPLDSWASTPAPTGEALSTPTALKISASVGPLHYLSGAKLVVKDARGKIVGRATTNIRGAGLVKLRPESRAKLPFRITATGGRVLESQSNGIKGPRFQGALRAKVVNLDANGGALVYLDLVSTLASRLESRNQDYASAFEKVRGALGIKSPVSPNVIRFQNNHVGWVEIESEIKQKKGFGPFVQSLENKIKRGESLAYLKPSAYRLKQPISGASAVMGTPVSTGGMARIAATSSSYSPCDSQLGNTSSNGGTSSTELITAVGVEASKELLSIAGLSALGFGVDMAAGMLFTGGNETSPESEALKQVSQQLECISMQINYLSGQVDQLMVYETVGTATQCDANVASYYKDYEWYVDAAQPNDDGTPSGYQLNDSNAIFTDSLKAWSGMYSCGATINNMLWGTAGAQGPAWQSINVQYHNAYPWWTQQQVQELQDFLAYWSMRLHQAFVLHTEYLNYYQQFDKAKAEAGAYESPEGELSSELCTTNTTYYPETFCVWQNKIPGAYPKDLFSDEVAIPATGLAVHVLPGSYGDPSIPTLTNEGTLDDSNYLWYPVDAKYIVQEYAREGEDKKVFATVFDDIASKYEQAFIISPGNGGSAVENYRNLKARHASATREQVEVLNQPGPPGPWVPEGAQSTVDWFFASQVASVDGPSADDDDLWQPADKGYTFYTREDVGMVTWTPFSYSSPPIGYLFEPRSSVLSLREFEAANGCEGDQKNRYYCSYYAPHHIGVLQQREWWKDAAGAMTYKPGCPPLPEGQQC